jgi:hypothetical protein
MVAGTQFETAPDKSGCARLCTYVIGDYGSGDAWQAKVAAAMTLMARKEPPDLVLGTGDCVYLAGDDPLTGAPSADILSERFDPYYQALATDFFQCLGNHDLIDVFGGDPAAMIAHTYQSRIWRMPSSSYGIRGLPPWVGVHVLNSNVFGFDGNFAEGELFSEPAMERELEAATEYFSGFQGLKILVGHHPVFTSGKRTYRYQGDGEIRCMRRLREMIDGIGVHFYLSGHEHHQSHATGPTCEHIVQGCGGAGAKQNPRHSRRINGTRLSDKIFRFQQVMSGFAILDMDQHFNVRVRFIGIPAHAPADQFRVIYEYYWSGLDEIGDRSLRPCRQPNDNPRRRHSG